MSEGAPITRLIHRWNSGDATALEELIPLIYRDLKSIAHRHLALRGMEDGTINTTGLVHELYMNLAARDRVRWNDRNHFFAAASKAMRHLVIDYVRASRAEKRGGDRVRVPLLEGSARTGDGPLDLLELDEALERLAQRDARLGQVVECRFFGGMTMDEIADALGVAKRTVERDWARARSYLYQDLT